LGWFLCVSASVNVRAQNIELILKQRVNSDRNQASIVVAVVDETGTKFFAYGKRSKLEGARPANENTVFEIGSITKVFTGILLAEAVKRREVKLDDPISKYLPKSVVTPKYNGKEITLLNLIWHTSGLPFKPDNLHPKDPAKPWADYTAKELYEFIGRYQLKREPPTEFDYTKFEYSNLGVGLLGHILSLRANTSYENLVKTRILRPLRMLDTAIVLTRGMKARLAVGYNADGDQTPNWDLPVLEGCGALRSTASDMAKFISANLGFTSRAGVALDKARDLTWNKGTIVAGKLLHNKSNVLYHGGSTGGYLSFVAIDTAQKNGVFVVTNSQDSVEDIGFHIIHNSFPLKATAEPRTQIILSETILERYVGEYQLSDLGIRFVISRKGQRLFLQQNGEDRVGLFAQTESKFFLKVVDATITFTKDEDGNVNGLVLHQKGDHTGRKIK
jgi:D-alanyl-D-alanine-carboxypeptidase/D-alanyl-D-alanine-endopeptidase